MRLDGAGGPARMGRVVRSVVMPMNPEIRTIRDDELPAFADTMSSSFLERPDVDRVSTEIRPLWDLDVPDARGNRHRR